MIHLRVEKIDSITHTQWKLTLPIESTTGIKKSNKQTEARKSERQKIRLRSTDEKKN